MHCAWPEQWLCEHWLHALLVVFVGCPVVDGWLPAGHDGPLNGNAVLPLPPLLLLPHATTKQAAVAHAAIKLLPIFSSRTAHQGTLSRGPYFEGDTTAAPSATPPPSPPSRHRPT